MPPMTALVKKSGPMAPLAQRSLIFWGISRNRAPREDWCRVESMTPATTRTR